nr:PspC domain-containing protein [Anaerolineae bacterium]
MTNRKLVRRSKGAMVAGVCTGIADYFNVDPVIVRLVFVVLALADGLGLLLYIALAILTPASSAATQTAHTIKNSNGSRPSHVEFEPLGSRDN